MASCTRCNTNLHTLRLPGRRGGNERGKGRRQGQGREKKRECLKETETNHTSTREKPARDRCKNLKPKARNTIGKPMRQITKKRKGCIYPRAITQLSLLIQ